MPEVPEKPDRFSFLAFRRRAFNTGLRLKEYAAV